MKSKSSNYEQKYQTEERTIVPNDFELRLPPLSHLDPTTLIPCCPVTATTVSQHLVHNVQCALCAAQDGSFQQWRLSELIHLLQQEASWPSSTPTRDHAISAHNYFFSDNGQIWISFGGTPIFNVKRRHRQKEETNTVSQWYTWIRRFFMHSQCCAWIYLNLLLLICLFPKFT